MYRIFRHRYRNDGLPLSMSKTPDDFVEVLKAIALCPPNYKCEHLGNGGVAIPTVGDLDDEIRPRRVISGVMCVTRKNGKIFIRVPLSQVEQYVLPSPR